MLALWHSYLVVLHMKQGNSQLPALQEMVLVFFRTGI